MALSTLETLRATVAALTFATGESQATLAAGIGLTQSQVSRRQNGPSAWTLDDVDALAAHWAIPVLDLLAGPSRASEVLPAERRRVSGAGRAQTPPQPSTDGVATAVAAAVRTAPAEAAPTAAPAPLHNVPAAVPAPTPVSQPAAEPEDGHRADASTQPDPLPAPAGPDRSADGTALVATPEPCVICGRPTPYRAAGRPQHLHGLCQAAPGPNTRNTPNHSGGDSGGQSLRDAATPADGPADQAVTAAKTTSAPAQRRERGAAPDLLDQIAQSVAEQLDRSGGDIDQATTALVKRAIPDAMALLAASRVGSRYEYTAYPPLPEILRKKSRSGPDAIWEARPKWRNPQLKRRGGAEHTVAVLDMNGAYLSALKTHLPIGQLAHDPTGEYDPKKSGLYLVTPPAWEHQDIPNPIGNRDEPGPLWLTDPTVRLLLRLAGPKYGLCEPPVIHEAWTAHSTENVLEKFRQALAAAREEAIAEDDTVTLEYVKAMYSKFVSTIGESGSNHQIRRPDWMHLIRSQAFTNLWLKGLKGHQAGLLLVQMAGTDELHVTGDWRRVFPEGRRISEVKMKDEYTIGGDA